MPPRCPARHDLVWSWTLNPRELRDMSVSDMIDNQLPREDGDGFRAFWRRHKGNDNSDHWLIRFSMFSTSRYQGTVGRADAAYVFFSELDQALARGLTMRDAVRDSGSTTQEIDNAASDQTVFVWIVAPAENGDFTKIATWQNVFHLLKSIDVSPSILNIMAQRKPPLARSLQKS
jgi:hypothetical protein